MSDDQVLFRPLDATLKATIYLSIYILYSIYIYYIICIILYILYYIIYIYRHIYIYKAEQSLRDMVLQEKEAQKN